MPGSPHERRAYRLYHCGDEGRLRRGADHGARGNGHCRLQCGGQRDRARSGSGTYRLIPGERYTWITTKQEFYHAAGSFEAAAGLTVQASEPDTTDRLSALASYSARNPKNGVSYESDVPFSAAQHRYTLTVPDANSTFYLQATPTGRLCREGALPPPDDEHRHERHAGGNQRHGDRRSREDRHGLRPEPCGEPAIPTP